MDNRIKKGDRVYYLAQDGCKNMKDYSQGTVLFDVDNGYMIKFDLRSDFIYLMPRGNRIVWCAKRNIFRLNNYENDIRLIEAGGQKNGKA